MALVARQRDLEIVRALLKTPIPGATSILLCDESLRFFVTSRTRLSGLFCERKGASSYLSKSESSEYTLIMQTCCAL